MLVGYYVILVFWVDRLVLGRYMDVFRRELRRCGVGEGLKEVGVVRVVHVKVRGCGVACLCGVRVASVGCIRTSIP